MEFWNVYTYRAILGYLNCLYLAISVYFYQVEAGESKLLIFKTFPLLCFGVATKHIVELGL